MHLGINGKRAVRMAGCALFCLMVLVLAFWNRKLILEPVTEFLRGNYGFEDMKKEVQENYLDDRFRGKNELITLNGGYARLQGRTRYNGVQLMKNGMITSWTSKMMDTSDFAESISGFSRYLDGLGIPFLFVMEPFKIPTEENLLPAGVTALTLYAFSTENWKWSVNTFTVRIITGMWKAASLPIRKSWRPFRNVFPTRR